MEPHHARDPRCPELAMSAGSHKPVADVDVEDVDMFLGARRFVATRQPRVAESSVPAASASAPTANSAVFQ